jgi:glycosyltransferase involved in cell wall biosynthesis
VTPIPLPWKNPQGFFVTSLKKALNTILPHRWYESLSKLWQEVELVDRTRVVLFADSNILPAYIYSQELDLALLRSCRVKVTLISTCLNEEKTVQHWLNSLLTQTRLPDELIITDGGSKDSTVELIQKFAENCPVKLTLIVSPGVNISMGRNLAIQKATTPVIVVTDFGCVYEPDWLERMVYPFEVNPEFDVSMGYYKAITNTLFERISASFLIHKLEDVDPQNFMPSSRCIAFRKKLWAMVGGYPEWLTNEGEDTLFDYELKRIKAEWAFVPSAQVSWHPPGSLREVYKSFWHYARGDGESGIFASRYWYFISLAILWDFGLLILLAISLWLISINQWTRLGLVGALVVLGIVWIARAYLKLPERPHSISEFIQIRAIAATVITAKNCGFLQGLRNRPDVFKRQQTSWIAELNRILKEYPDRKGIILYPPTHDWGFMFQRPHQLARAFAKEGYLFFYFTENKFTDGIVGFYQAEGSLYVCHVPLHLFRDLPCSILYIGSPWNRGLLTLFKGMPVIYDQYDDLEVSAGTLEDYQILLSSAKLVLVSSQRLYETVQAKRADVLLIPNGVDYDFIQTFKPAPGDNPPDDLIEILANGRPLVGYSGALAEWFDYDLLRQAALALPELEFVLVGVDYDLSLSHSAVLNLPNVHWLGMKDYDRLFHYVWRFDIGIIPFKINKVTLSTSPIKLFEYMACNKPVVTTALPECMRYSQVYIGVNYSQFLESIGLALHARDDAEYMKALSEVAMQNTWEKRVEKIITRFVQSNKSEVKG